MDKRLNQTLILREAPLRRHILTMETHHDVCIENKRVLTGVPAEALSSFSLQQSQSLPRAAGSTDSAAWPQLP